MRRTDLADDLLVKPGSRVRLEKDHGATHGFDKVAAPPISSASWRG